MAVPGYGRLRLWQDGGALSEQEADEVIKNLYDRSVPKWNFDDASIPGEYLEDRPVDSAVTGNRYKLKVNGNPAVNPDDLDGANLNQLHWELVFIGDGSSAGGIVPIAHDEGTFEYAETPTDLEIKTRAEAISAKAGSVIHYTTPHGVIIKYDVMSDGNNGIVISRITPTIMEYSGNTAADLPDELDFAPNSRFIWNQAVPLSRYFYLVDANQDYLRLTNSGFGGSGDSSGGLKIGRGTLAEMNNETDDDYAVWVVTDAPPERGTWYRLPGSGWEKQD